MIVDFGSKYEYASVIRSLCEKYDGDYIFIEDYDTFSASKARNLGFKNLKTDYLLLADIDYVYESDIFSRLASLANKLNLEQQPLRVITMPIYHVNKEATNIFESIDCDVDKDRLLALWGTDGLTSKFGTLFEFVAPYSNSIFLHRKMFDISGGYCDEFRGHGSEDFEFLIRLAKLTIDIPAPKGIEKDFYGPLKTSFWGQKDYVGFRRYLEAFTLPCELLGLKTFHLWHEKPADKGYWTQTNDWKRARFNIVMDRHAQSASQLLSVDYIKRDKQALCIFSDQSQWGYFLPLRLAGYNLTTLTEKNDNAIAHIMRRVESLEFDRVFIFNPYMKSHVAFRGVIEVARKLGIQVSVVERGGLPNTIYYADEVAYGDSDYKNIKSILANENFSELQLNTANKILEKLRAGEHSLESMESYDITWHKHALLRLSSLKKVFIPLQLRDDMAVNYFTDGYSDYSSFEDGIVDAVKEYPNVIFIIKEHPLSKYDMSWTNSFENVVCVSQNDNIHALLDIADNTVLYNSGVGLLALAHRKKIYHIGNAYYSADDLFSIHKKSVVEAVSDIQNNNEEPDVSELKEKVILKFFSWLIFNKYSWFTANDLIREFSDRKSHAYDNINVNILNLDSITYFSGRSNVSHCYSNNSYLNWHLNLNVGSSEEKIKVVPKNKSKDIVVSVDNNKKNNDVSIAKIQGNSGEKENKKIVSRHPNAFGLVSINIIKYFVNDKKRKKLINNPELFFIDSKSSLLKKVGAASFK
ncbi:capsular polysaccharide export protein, LipB/KpsS family [Atlantibacter hermannii]|nr:hypothetical protein [Atlantibacter hermannii]